MTKQELKARIDNIISGENCRHIEKNMPCNYILADTAICRDCQSDQILNFTGNIDYFEESAMEYCRKLGWKEPR